MGRKDASGRMPVEQYRKAIGAALCCALHVAEDTECGAKAWVNATEWLNKPCLQLCAAIDTLYYATVVQSVYGVAVCTVSGEGVTARALYSLATAMTQ